MKNFRDECAIVCITTPMLDYVTTVVHNSTGVFLTGKGINQGNLEYNLLLQLREKVYPAKTTPKPELPWV